MNNLIISYSPISKSFTVKLADLLTELYTNKGENVEVRDLLKLNFSPVLTETEIEMGQSGQFLDDVKVEQEHILWSDHVLFIYPLYQLAMPAVMKGYVDRVLCQNFAYAYNNDGNSKKLMEGKTVSIFSPMGSPYEYFESTGSLEAMKNISNNIFSFRGFTLRGVHYFDMKSRDISLEKLERIMAA